jgi:hypothetical protein
LSTLSTPFAHPAGLASEVARLRARFVIKDSDDSLKGAA